MAGNDSGFSSTFKMPELPHLGSAAHTSVFDASAFQGGRALSFPLEHHSNPFTSDNSLTIPPVFTLASSPDNTAGAGRAVEAAPARTAETSIATPSPFDSTTALPVMPVESVLAMKTADAVTLSPDSKLQPGQAPDVSVRYSDQASDLTAQTKPTVAIDKAGNLLDANGQPFDTASLDYSKTGMPKDIVIQLQHDQGDAAGATKAQQDALNGFLKNQLDPALRQQNDAATKQGIDVDDQTGQVQKDVADNLARVQPPEAPQPEMAPQTEAAVGNINRDMPSDNQVHSMPARQANNYFSKADVPQGEDRQVTAEKDMLAALEGNKDNPYETVQQRGDRSYAVGRYGNSWNQFNNYMMMALTPEMLALLGNPPDYSKLGQILKDHPEMLKKLQDNMHQLAKDGKIPGTFADRFKTAESAEHFGNFVDKLHGNKGPLTADEIKQNAPKEMQEQMTADFVKHGIANGANPGKIALANQLGKNPEELTAQDVNDPKNTKFMEAANKYYSLATARQHANPDDNIDYKSTSGDLSDMQLRIARASGSHDLGGSAGRCAEMVQRDLAKAGINVLGWGNAWDMGMKMKRSGEFVAIDPKKAAPGDIVFWHDPNYYGHVESVKARNGNTVTCESDFRSQHNVNELGKRHGKYDTGMVLRYVGKGGAQVQDDSKA